MNIQRLAVAIAAASAATLVAALPALAADDTSKVTGEPFAIASSPVQIDSCGAIHGERHLRFAVTFRDTQPRTAIAVAVSNLLIDPFDTVLGNETETFTGTYSPNVAIEDSGIDGIGQKMQVFHSEDAYSSARTDVCYVSAVKFDDGTIWRPASAELPPAAIAPAP